jgi:hypothetical protein
MNNENQNSGNSPEVVPTLPAAKSGLNKTLLFILGYVVLLIALGVLVFQLKSETNKSTQANSRASGLETELKTTKEQLAERQKTTGEEEINHDVFQAVFLKGGQTYFGKITKLTEKQLILEDIYYLRHNKTTNKAGEDVTLVKLGEELHGPEDKMIIERKEVQFFENLKADSDVSKAIKEYESSKL